MSLSSLIVQREIATIRQVEEALARQVLYGGDLVTNLLEVASDLSEAQLTAVLSVSFDKEPATAGPLPTPSPQALAMIPSELASRRSVFPIEADAQRLLLAVAEPLPREEEEGLAFALGLRIDSRVALYPRVREAIAFAYGIPVDRRVERLLTKLRGGDSQQGPTSRPPLLSAPPEVNAPDRPKSIPPFRLSPAYGVAPVPPPSTREPLRHVPTNAGFPAPVLHIPIGEQAQPEVHQAVTVPPPVLTPPRVETLTTMPPTHPPDVASATRTFAKPTSQEVRPARRRRGPLTFDVAKQELESATDRDGLLDLFFEFSRQFFDYSAMFIALGDLAEGRDAYGDGASREVVVGIGVPLDLPSILVAARDQKKPVVTAIADGGVDAVLAHDLGRKAGVEALALPLLVRGRAVAILYADSGSAGIDRDSIKDVLAFGAMIGQGFEKLIVKKKLAGFASALPSDALAGRAEVSALAPISKRAASRPPPDPSARAEALANAMSSVPAGSERPGAFRPQVGEKRQPTTNPETPIARGSIPAALRPDSVVPAPPERRRDQPSVPPPAVAPALVPPTGGAIVGRDRGSKPPPPNLAYARVPSGPPIPREDEDAAPIELLGPRISSPVVELNLPRNLEVPIILSEEVDDEEAAALLAEIDAGESGDGSHTLEIEEDSDVPSSIVVPPRRPPSSRGVTPSSTLPSVIIDMDHEMLALVDLVAFGQDDGSSEGELLRQGQHAMPAIMARFPGPLRVDRSQLTPPLPKASDCGAVLRLVAGQRRVAVPFVLAVAVSDDVSVRFWATFLLAELPYVEVVPTIVARLYDADPRVRMASRAAAKATSDVAHEALLSEIGKVLRDQNATRGARIGVTEALGEMRESLAVPVLIRSLSDRDEELATVARRALIAITRQDFQRDEKRWLAWWGQNSARHRVEWLVDALTDETPGIRRAAADELKSITGETFGYYEDLPKRDRERAQQRFRDWWLQEGRAKFVAP